MKNIRRLRARVALNALRESKTWIAKKHLVLETEEGDMEIAKNDAVIMGATEDGNVAIKSPEAIVVIADDALATKVVDSLKNSEELGDVEFVQGKALDKALDGTSVEEIVDGLIDAAAENEDADEIEVATVDVSDDSTVEEKCESIAKNIIALSGKVLTCEAVLVDEADDAPIDLGAVSTETVAYEDVLTHDEFTSKVAEMNGSIQPGLKEIALGEDNKVIGYFDSEAGNGRIYMDNAFDSADEMDAFDVSAEKAVQPMEFEAEMGEAVEVVEASLKAYEESEKSANDLFAMEEALLAAGLTESVIGTIANSFVSRSLTEGVNVFDTKLGKVVASFKESVDANNYIAGSAEEARFTKRYFK